LFEFICPFFSFYADIVVDLLAEDKRPKEQDSGQMLLDAHVCFSERLSGLRAEAQGGKAYDKGHNPLRSLLKIPLYSLLPGQLDPNPTNQLLVWFDKRRNEQSFAYELMLAHHNPFARRPN
jgi:hypothetical protein